MKRKLQLVLKNLLIGLLCIVSVSTAIVSTIPVAEAKGSSGILGTRAALGSPILNENFVLEDWNKWEIICWGVFLSNFCQPLIDDYQSAFTVGNKGSNGSGYKALVFGSGNDQKNNETIQALCNYAIAQSTISSKEIYVGFTDINNTLGEKPDPNVDANAVRRATFRDLFFDKEADSSIDLGNSYIKYAQAGEDEMGVSNWAGWQYSKVNYITSGKVPTFYVKNKADRFIVLWDYTDSWDVQMITAMLNTIRNDQYGSEFKSNFDDLWSSNPLISMDAFANIIVNGKMVVPASINQHITKSNDINLINSWVMNNYTSTYSDEQLMLGLRQSSNQVWIANEARSQFSGYPAFGDSNIGTVGLLYYDTDSIVMNRITEHLKSGGTMLTPPNVNYGDVVRELFDTDISNNKSKYPLKFEVSNINIKLGKWFPNETETAFIRTILASSMLPNIYTDSTQDKRFISSIYDMYGNKLDLFSNEPVIIPVQMLKSKPSDEPSNQGAVRNFYNFIYNAYKGNIAETATGHYYSPEYIKADLQGASFNKFQDDFAKNAFAWFKEYNTTYSKVGDLTSDWRKFWDYGKNETINDDRNRLVKVYPVTETLKHISDIMCVAEGTEFSVYSTMIYMTYLDWYGLNNQSTSLTNTDDVSNFNPDIYDESSDILNFDPSSVIDVKSEEEMESEVLSMSYYLLHPEQGREYRKQLITNGMADWVYDQYNKIVYGGYESTYGGMVTNSSNGFLAIQPYSENLFTGFILDYYVNIAIVLIGLSFLFALLTLIFKKRKISWFLVMIVVSINTILLVPSSGEIVPYLTSNFVQKMFSSRMTYWSVSQAITNATMEKDAVQSSDADGLSSNDAQTVIAVIKQLSVIYTDRSLMVKQDISQKVTQATVGSYSNIQSIQSARWILPIVMQQFTGDNKTEDYIYKSVANIFDDLSNMYWYFKPEDAAVANAQSPTATSGQGGDSVPSGDTKILYNNKNIGYFTDADKDKDKLLELNSVSNADKSVNYHCYSYTVHGNADEQVHLVAYLLPDASRKTASIKDVNLLTNYKDADSWSSYINRAKTMTAKKENWSTGKDTNSGFKYGGFEYTADSYNRMERSTITPDMPYLLHTESPVYYFYNVVKDSFETDSNIGQVIGELQGTIELDENGEEVRNNFMYATKSDLPENQVTPDTAVEYTGWTRDMLDLEELFTNTIPYLYEMQLIAGGFDGTSGVLGDDIISEDLQYYDGELQSWMYRCNWATKIMENPDYSEGCTVRNSSGQEVKVKYPAMPSSYKTAADGRPMVFSEAQMHAMGLKEGDLSLVELKCIEANKKVARQWTMLINYAGTSGITKEVLMRQMALDATLIFCDEFSSAGVISTMYAMYPQSIDLRYISFDSIIKMILMNTTRNTQYAYGDTMATVMNTSNLFVIILLWLDALFCAEIIPFFRELFMAIVLYAGLFATIQCLGSSNQFKAKMSLGQIITNLIFMGYTLLYYGAFSLMIKASTQDQVLNVGNIKYQQGRGALVPLLIIAFVNIAYIVIGGLHAIKLMRNYHDMGFETYSAVASGIVGGIGKMARSIPYTLKETFGGDSKFSSFFDSEAAMQKDKENATSNTNSVKGYGKKKKETQDVNIRKTDSSAITLSDERGNTSAALDDIGSTNYNITGDIETDNGNTVAMDIDAQIEAGSKLDIDS